MVDASVLVVGGGAVGGILAGVMQGAVRRVVVLDTHAEHVARMREGLQLVHACERGEARPSLEHVRSLAG